MNELLEKNLESGERFWKVLERSFRMQLTSETRKDLIQHSQGLNYSCYDDLYKDWFFYLWNKGYQGPGMNRLKIGFDKTNAIRKILLQRTRNYGRRKYDGD